MTAGREFPGGVAAPPPAPHQQIEDAEHEWHDRHDQREPYRPATRHSLAQEEVVAGGKGGPNTRVDRADDRLGRTSEPSEGFRRRWTQRISHGDARLPGSRVVSVIAATPSARNGACSPAAYGIPRSTSCESAEGMTGGRPACSVTRADAVLTSVRAGSSNGPRR